MAKINSYDFVVEISPDQEQEFDYKGFMEEFRKADESGIEAIKEVYDNNFEKYKDDVDFFESFVLTLNHQLWNWYRKEGQTSQIGLFYNDLWMNAHDYACDNYTGEKLLQYLRFVD